MAIPLGPLLSDPSVVSSLTSEIPEINGPTVINIKGYEPLYLARKKHYIPQREKKEIASSFKIAKKSHNANYNILNIDKKTQGRPFNDNLNARFLCFQNIESLISNLLNLKTNRFDKELNQLRTQGESDKLLSCPPSPNLCISLSPLSRRSSASSISSMSSSTSLDALSSVSSASSTGNASRNPTISKLVNNYSINTNFIINYDNALAQNFITSTAADSTYDDTNIARNDPNDFVTQSIEFQNFNNIDSELDIPAELCNVFGCQAISFVKIIRNNKGKLIKFEIICSKNQSNDMRLFDINFIKKFITYPRYKSKMKIYLIKGDFEKKIWFYNDIRMLIWDLENLNMNDKKVLINNNILNN